MDARVAPAPRRPRLRLTWTTSKPPEPSPRSRACGVDDDLVADLDRARPASCRPRPGGARRRPRPSAGRPRRPCRGAASARPAHSSASRRAPRSPRRRRASRSSRGAATLSCGVWLASVPLASSTQSKPRAISAFASLPPPVATSRGSIPRRSSAARASRDRRRARPQAVAAEDLGHVDVDVAAVLARGPGAGVDHRRGRRGDPRLVERPRLRLDPAAARRRRSRPTPPAITPTFAVVSSSSRPRSIAPIAAAAASIAEWPSSGRIPACASSPSNSATSRW